MLLRYHTYYVELVVPSLLVCVFVSVQPHSTLFGCNAQPVLAIHPAPYLGKRKGGRLTQGEKKDAKKNRTPSKKRRNARRILMSK